MATYSVTLTGSWGPATGAMGDSDCYVEIGSVQYKSAQVIEVQSGTVIRVYSKSPSTGYVAKIYMDDSVVSQSTDNNLYAEYELSVDSHCTINSKSNGVPSTYTIYNIYIVKEAPSKNHKTLIGGTGYEISCGRTLVDGTGYDIAKGRTLVGGTGYDIAFGMPIGSLPVGTSIYANVNGELKEFLIAHQGNPNTSLYDASCNGTWLLMKDIYELRVWSTSSGTRVTYKTSNIHTYLNDTFLGTIDSALQNAIKSVKIPYSSSSGSTVYELANGVSASVFLLAAFEVGFDESNYYPVDGAKLDYFVTGYDASAISNRLAMFNGEASKWWTRTPRKKAKSTVICVPTPGGSYFYGNTWSNTSGIRPACIVYPETLVNPSDYTIIG